MEMQDLSESTTKEQQTQNTVWGKDKRRALGCLVPLLIGGILAVPVTAVFNLTSDKEKAKSHPNIVKEVFRDYILIQDVKDNKERLVSKKIMLKDADDANYFYKGDTVHFYSHDYDKKLAFDDGVLVYNKDTVQHRADREISRQLQIEQKFFNTKQR